MAANVLALFRPVRSEARAALAEAIAEARAAEAALTAAQSAVARGRDMVDQAGARHDAAAEALSAAKSALAGLLAGAAASSGALRVRDTTVRGARADEDEAADHLNAAVDALAELEATAGAAQNRLADAQAGIKRAARGVIAEAIDPRRAIAAREALDAQTQKLRAGLIKQVAALRFVNYVALGGDRYHNASDLPPLPDEFKHIVRTILTREKQTIDPEIQQSIWQAFAAAFEALHDDPDFPTPVFDKGA